MTHFPGPWRIVGEFDAEQAIEIRSADDRLVCEIEPFTDEWTEEEIANVRAIAATPDLLAGCKLAVHNAAIMAGAPGKAWEGDFVIREMQHAIAKAARGAEVMPESNAIEPSAVCAPATGAPDPSLGFETLPGDAPSAESRVTSSQLGTGELVQQKEGNSL